MSNKSVTPYKATLPVKAVADPLDPMSQVRGQDIILPIRKLVQPQSRMEGGREHSGEFWDNLSGKFQPKLRVAVLKISYSRSLFAGGSFDQPPVCASDAAFSPRVVAEVGGQSTGPTCAKCPFSQWGSAGEGRKGQACHETRNLLCLDLDSGEPFILRVSGVSIKPWSLYVTARGRTGLGFLKAEIVIGSGAKLFDAGQAYILSFETGAKFDEATVSQLRELAGSYAGLGLGVEEQLAADEVDKEAEEKLFA